MADLKKKKKPGQTVITKPAVAPLKERIEKWCVRQRRIIFFGIIIFSSVLRVVYFLELDKTHLVNEHRWDESDMYVFDQWAKHISKGDVLSETYIQPEHHWMGMISESYFREHPDKLAEFRAKAAPDTSFAAASRLLWSHWYGVKAFPHEPLYTYFVALNYKFFGTDVRWVFLWQMMLGIITNVLIWLVTRKLFGDLAGLAAAFLAVFTGPMLFYEMVLLRSSLACFMTILVIYMSIIAFEKNTFSRWLAAGLICGIAMMVHTYFILFFLGMIALSLLLNFKNLSHTGKTAGGFALGFILALSPVMIRNAMMGLGLLTMSNAGAVSFITMNDNYFPGSFIGWSLNVDNVTRIMAETDGGFLKTIILTLQTHSSIGSYLSLVWDKLHASFSWFEIPNNVNFYFYREYAPVLYFTFVSFLIIAPLAFSGIIFSILKKKKTWTLWLMFLVMMFPMLAFMVLSRYRIAMVVVLIPFAAYAIAEFFKPWRWKWNIPLFLTTCLIAWWCWLPRDSSTEPLSKLDYQIVYKVFYNDSLQVRFDRHEWKSFITLLDEYISDYEPGGLTDKLDYYKCRNDKESGIFDFFSMIHNIKSTVFLFDHDSLNATREARVSQKLKNATQPVR